MNVNRIILYSPVVAVKSLINPKAVWNFSANPFIDMMISLDVSFWMICFFLIGMEFMLILLLIARMYGSGNELFDGTIIQSLQSVETVVEGDDDDDDE